MSGYINNTSAQQEAMLDEIGLSIDGLFSDIPESIRLHGKLEIGSPLSEIELSVHMRDIAAKNKNLNSNVCFLGAGVYDHYIPAAVKSIISRQEFYTAYTPYQPEISQGTLQTIFEYQTMICELTGMDASNASMYDGASAIAEAAHTARLATGRSTVIMAAELHPESREVVKTYSTCKGKTEELESSSGTIDLKQLEERLHKDTAAVIVQTPNFFGLIEDLRSIAELAHKNGSLLIVSCNPIALALIASPGECGADIAVGEGQPLGSALCFGGPHFGFFAVKEALIRKMPGRIVGQTEDKNSKRGFVLTLQTREQHIRREKATSNICSNHSLNAIAAAVYLTLLGKKGLYDTALLCAQKAHYAHDKLLETGKFEPVFNAPFFNEFTLRYKGNLHTLNERLLIDNIIGGFELEREYSRLHDCWLIAFTEKRTRAEIDRLVERAGSIC